MSAVAAVTGAAFAALYAGHKIGDLILQTDKWAAAKTQPTGWLVGMVAHLATYHAAAFTALFGLSAIGVPLSLPHILAALTWSAVTHGFLDRRWPVRWLLVNTGSAEFADRQTPICGAYEADQALHVAALFIAALIIGAGA